MFFPPVGVFSLSPRLRFPACLFLPALFCLSLEFKHVSSITLETRPHATGAVRRGLWSGLGLGFLGGLAWLLSLQSLQSDWVGCTAVQAGVADGLPSVMRALADRQTRAEREGRIGAQSIWLDMAPAITQHPWCSL